MMATEDHYYDAADDARKCYYEAIKQLRKAGVISGQFTPRNDLRGLGEHCLDFHILNRIGRLFGLNHTADQKVLLFGDGCDRSPLGQQQFFGVQRIHA